MLHEHKRNQVVPRTMNNRELTEDSLNLFLKWIAPDPDSAGSSYEAIRRRLIALFVRGGCACSEDLADKTIDRVIARLPAIIDSYTGEPVAYLLKVAHHLHLEYLEKQPAPLSSLPPDKPLAAQDTAREEEQAYECLEKCLKTLTPKNQELVIAYYQQEKRAKIDFRKKLARQTGIAVNALRIRMHRTREYLQKCILECLSEQSS